jgi:hypothetical protein
MNETITKKVEPTNDVCIKFTEEEMQKLNISPGDKFSVHIEDNGVMLKKFVKVEIDMSDWSRETLENLIAISCEDDISINQIICDTLTKNIPEDIGKENGLEMTMIEHW